MEEDTKLIYLTQGKVTIVDTEDYDMLMRYTWFAHKETCSKIWYPKTSLDAKTKICMHQLLLPVLPPYEVDHIDNDGLNNRKLNLRSATHSQNNQNKLKGSNNTSGYKGVAWCSQNDSWQVSVSSNGVRIHGGYFSDKHIAALARDIIALKYHKEFAVLNILNPLTDDITELETKVEQARQKK